MKIVVLGGSGEMGRVVVRDLADTCKDCDVIIAGRDGRKETEFARSFKKKNVTGAKVDVRSRASTVSLLKGSDVVINCVNYYYNLDVMRACLEAGVDYVDLGGLFHMTRKQLELDNEFRKRNLIAVIGCGATPGITNVMAAHGARSFDKIDSIHVQFADADCTKYAIPFVVPYSMYTIFDEFMKEPAVFENGKFKFVEPFSGTEAIDFPEPVNSVKCFNTLHSEVATFPMSFKNKGIKNCSFKGGFDKEFVSKVKFLIDTGFASDRLVRVGGVKIRPVDFTVNILNKFIPSDDVNIDDVEFLRVEIFGIKDGRKKKIAVYCKSVSNKKWNIPAGTWNTGTPPSIAAQMIVGGQVKATGVLPPELCLEPEIFFKELKKRDMEIFVEKLS